MNPITASPLKWYHRLGPGLITACVVIGPGSILTSSNVGARQGYSMAWVVVLSVVFMLTYMTMGARLGVATGRSAASVISERAGRWLAVAIGLCVFFISAAFQFGNNLGVHFALVSYIPFDYLVVIFNALAIGFLLIFKDMYRVLEKLMMTFVGIMLVSFALNLIVSGPRIGEMASGFVPSPGDISLSVLGLIGTTFVTTAAFYQSYLVRQKGWTTADLKSGMIDVRVGALLMALITLMLMFTPATQFHPTYRLQHVVSTTGDSSFTADRTIALDLPVESPEYAKQASAIRSELDPETGKSAWVVIPLSEFREANKQIRLANGKQAKATTRGFNNPLEVGRALEPLFKGLGPTLFFLGLFAAAYSSFLVNSMIGGFMLADGLGMGDSPADAWPRRFTILVLLVGMSVGLYVIIVLEGQRPVTLIVAAQAVTVLASPLVAGSLLWLTSSRAVMGEHVNGPVLKTLGLIGFLLLIAMSIRTADKLIVDITEMLATAG
jgi:Mn2+/Fe2+ NRAMP family transporter